jgi:hypothetical protein
MSELNDYGLSYTSLRYMHNDFNIRAEMEKLPEFQLEFSYVPRAAVNKINQPNTEIKVARESQGATEGVMHSKFPPFGKAFYTDNNKLTIKWGYCPTQHTNNTIKIFIDNQIKYLLDLIDNIKGSK